MRAMALASALALGCWLGALAPAGAERAEAAQAGPSAGGAEIPAPPRSETGPGLPGPPIPALPSPGDLLPDLDPRTWARALLEAVAELAGEALVGAARGAVDWALGLGGSSLNFVTRTPEAGSYESPTVRSMWDLSRGVASAALGVIVMWGGLNVMLRRRRGSPYDGVMELVPRVLLAALAMHLTLEYARLLIDLNNALTHAVGQQGLPGYEQVSAGQSGLAFVVVALGYAVVALLLVLQMLLRLALIDLLIVLAPVMVLCWVLPQTQGWTRWWAQLLPLTVFQQVVQMVALRLGASLMVELTPGQRSDALLTLLLGGAVLWLALRVPSLLQGQLPEAGLGRSLPLAFIGRAAGGAAGGR